VLYIDWPKKDTSAVPIYAEAFGAKRHLDTLLQGLKYEITDKGDPLIGLIDDSRWLVAENGIRVRCNLLQEILDHVDSPEEEAWDMEARHKRIIEAFRYGEPITNSENYADSPISSDSSRESKLERIRERRENSAPRKPRLKPEGMITVAMIAEMLNILPREARSRLRRASVPKPDHGWMWDPDSADQVKKLIAKG